MGSLAQQQFPVGVLISSIEFEEAVRDTDAAIARGAKILFEPAFEYEGLRIRCNILAREGTKWILREVKSSTSVKEEYIADITVQTYVLRGLGYDVEPRLMYLDKTGTIESESLFIETDEEVTKLVDSGVPEIERLHPVSLEVLSSSNEPPPSKSRVCKHCEFRHHCFEEIDEHSVLDLYRGGERIDHLLDQGIEFIREIPVSTLTNEIQIRQVNSILTGNPFVSDQLAEELNQVEYPLYFLDFEVSAPAIPTFHLQHPYDKVPFQWSCHVLKSEDGELEHHEWLHADPSDPRRKFCLSLLDCIGETGTIVVYSHFESTVLRSMAEVFPDLVPQIEDAIERLWDLCAVIRDHFYHPDFRGSFSIKRVLPVLVPELTYEGMEISDGMEAVKIWNELVTLDSCMRTTESEKDNLRKSLLEYCALDSLAMIMVYQALRKALPHSLDYQLPPTKPLL